MTQCALLLILLNFLWATFSIPVTKTQFVYLLQFSVSSLQIMQSIGFVGPAFFLTQLSHVNSPAMAVLCMACSQVCFHFQILKDNTSLVGIAFIIFPKYTAL